MNERTPLPQDLSRREQDVARCLIEGASYALAARMLWLSPATVHSHAKRIYRKMGVHSRCELIARYGPDADECSFADCGLTPRERDVAVCLARGLTRRMAAEHLGLSPETVKAYTSSLFDKLGFDSRDDLLEFARQDRRSEAGGIANSLRLA